VKSKKNIVDNAANIGIAVNAQIQSTHLELALSSYSEKIKAAITDKANQFTNQSIAVQQGFALEAHHEASYNIEAIAKGELNLEASMDSVSAIDPLTDVTVKNTDGVIENFQMKSYADANKTARALSEPKYAENGIGKVAPSDQLSGIKDAAEKQAIRNQDIRPDVSKNYQDTADNVTDSISHSDNPNIKSKGLNRKGASGSEDLVKKTVKGEKVEYEHTDQARSTQQSLQYKNAIKYGAAAGFVSSTASEFYNVLTSDKKLTEEECVKIAERIVVGTAKGAGQALLSTTIQHAGKEIVKNTGKGAINSLGGQLAKGNVAANVAVLSVQLGLEIYKYKKGEIDGVELADNSINTTISLVAGAAGYAAGTAGAGFIGAHIGGAAVTAVAGFVGPAVVAAGPIAAGIAVAIVAGLVVNKYIDNCNSVGSKIAIGDIKKSASLLNNGDISLRGYVGKIGKMSGFTFGISDCMPLRGTFAVFGEYKARKHQLIHLQKEIAKKRSQLNDEEIQIYELMQTSYENQVDGLKNNLEVQMSQVDMQAQATFNKLQDELDQHLEMKLVMTATAVEFHQKIASEQELVQIKYKQRAEKLEVFRVELEVMRVELESDDVLSVEQRAYLGSFITMRIEQTLPEETPLDIAERFLIGASHA